MGGHVRGYSGYPAAWHSTSPVKRAPPTRAPAEQYFYPPPPEEYYDHGGYSWYGGHTDQSYHNGSRAAAYQHEQQPVVQQPPMAYSSGYTAHGMAGSSRTQSSQMRSRSTAVGGSRGYPTAHRTASPLPSRVTNGPQHAPPAPSSKLRSVSHAQPPAVRRQPPTRHPVRQPQPLLPPYDDTQLYYPPPSGPPPPPPPGPPPPPPHRPTSAASPRRVSLSPAKSREYRSGSAPYAEQVTALGAFPAKRPSRRRNHSPSPAPPPPPNPPASPPSRLGGPPLPPLQVHEGAPLDISQLIEQRRQLDEIIRSYEERSGGRPQTREPASNRIEDWRHEREAEIERLRMETKEREKVLQHERQRLAEMEAQLFRQREANIRREGEARRHRKMMDEFHEALLADAHAERHHRSMREERLRATGGDASDLEDRRRAEEDASREVLSQIRMTRDRAAALLDDELLMEALDSQRAERMRHQFRRDILAWEREERRNQLDRERYRSKSDALEQIQTRHREMLGEMDTRSEVEELIRAERQYRHQLEEEEEGARNGRVMKEEMLVLLQMVEQEHRVLIEVHMHNDFVVFQAQKNILLTALQIQREEARRRTIMWKEAVVSRAAAEDAARARQECDVLQIPSGPTPEELEEERRRAEDREKRRMEELEKRRAEDQEKRLAEERKREAERKTAEGC
eukprot:Sspe_Gene.40429::Locus_19527_Transcript_1_1_Confidence_1.000_Length_2088::g.40429::m.40429